MPLPNHCIECDKPIQEDIVCGHCREKLDGRICIRCNAPEDGCKCGDDE